MSIKRKASGDILTERQPAPPITSRSHKLVARKGRNIHSLNEELLLHIFSYLPLHNVLESLLVCHKWHRIAGDNKIWRDMYYAYFYKTHRFQATLSVGDNKPGFDWKSLFKLRYNWNRGSCSIKSIQFADSPGPSAPRKRLMASRNRIIATFSANYEMEVWSSHDSRCLARDRLQNWLESGTQLADIGTATAIIVNPVGALKFCVGFDTGSFIVVSLEDLKEGSTKLVPKHIAVLNHSRYGAIRHIVQRQDLLAVYTSFSNIILYSFANGVTKTLSVMKSYIDPSHEVAFTIRSVRYQAYYFCISLAYFQLTMSGEWIPCVQEILCNPVGRIVNTRMSAYSSNSNTHSRNSKWSIGYSSYPSAISYNHPYLVAGYADNTLSLYIARSAECCLEIQPRHRLWGHTSGIKHVFVKPSGTAVSVSSGAKEIRWWDLDQGNVVSNSVLLPENEAGAEVETGTFFSFDDEMIMVETLRNDEHFLMICDFR